MEENTEGIEVDVNTGLKPEELKEIMAGPRGFVVAPWCGEEGDETAMVQEETSATIRCLLTDREPEGECILTGRPAKYMAVFAKAY